MSANCLLMSTILAGPVLVVRAGDVPAIREQKRIQAAQLSPCAFSRGARSSFAHSLRVVKGAEKCCRASQRAKRTKCSKDARRLDCSPPERAGRNLDKCSKNARTIFVEAFSE